MNLCRSVCKINGLVRCVVLSPASAFAVEAAHVRLQCEFRSVLGLVQWAEKPSYQRTTLVRALSHKQTNNTTDDSVNIPHITRLQN